MMSMDNCLRSLHLRLIESSQEQRKTLTRLKKDISTAEEGVDRPFVDEINLQRARTELADVLKKLSSKPAKKVALSGADEPTFTEMSA